MDRRSEDRGSAAPASKRRKEKDNEIETVRLPVPSVRVSNPKGHGKANSQGTITPGKGIDIHNSADQKDGVVSPGLKTGLSSDLPHEKRRSLRRTKSATYGLGFSPTTEETKPLYRTKTFFEIDAELGHRPPKDPPEYYSNDTISKGIHWANCISGTLITEKRKIEEEGGRGVWVTTGHVPIWPEPPTLIKPDAAARLKMLSRQDLEFIPDESMLEDEKPGREDLAALEEWYSARAAPLPRCRTAPIDTDQCVIDKANDELPN